jgi:cyclic pyranopterin phosphate synthase
VIYRIRSVHGIKDISMTTNGTFLAEYAKKLREAGLDRVNVSLDSLNPEKFRQITCSDVLDSVISGIKEAVKASLCPVKVNMVLLKDLNEDEVAEMIAFTKKNGLILQIIELESSNEDEIFQKYHASLKRIEECLKSKADKVSVRRMHHRRKYYLHGGGEVEIVKPMHNREFCKYCNRIRITSDGKLKPCLFRNDNLIDLLSPMRRGASEEFLRSLFLEAVKMRKPYF